MRMRNILLIVAVTAVGSLGLAACGDSDDSTDTTSASAPAAGYDASVSFVTPTDGSTSGDTVTAEVDISGFDINADAVGKAATDGEGHIHFSMDGGEYDHPEYSGANGKLAKELGVDGMYSPSVTPEITYSGLPAGEHTLTVDLANNDHTPSGVAATTTFTVE